MICNRCGTPIPDEGIMVILCVEQNSSHSSQRFTGICWHPQCAPVHREFLLGEAVQLAARLGKRMEGAR